MQELLLPLKRAVYELISAKVEDPKAAGKQEPQRLKDAKGPFTQAIVDEKSARHSPQRK
jgi:hypothetical protein